MTLRGVILDNDSPGTLPRFIEADREQAVADLASTSHFRVSAAMAKGPRDRTFCTSPSPRDG